MSEFDALELATARRRMAEFREPPPLTVEEYCVLFRRFPILVKAWGEPDAPLTVAEAQQVIAGQMTHQYMAGAKADLRAAGCSHPLAALWAIRTGEELGLFPVAPVTAKERAALLPNAEREAP